MATFERTIYRCFNAKEIADMIEDFDWDGTEYEHNTKLIPIMDFAYSEDDCDDFDFELSKKEEDIIIKEVTEELKKRGWI